MKLDELREKKSFIKLETYKVLRTYIDEENKLLNYRLTWLLSINGFLFAAYALVLGKSIDSSADLNKNFFSCFYENHDLSADRFSILLGGICALGILLCLGSNTGIYAARRAINHLENFVDSEYALTALIAPIERKDVLTDMYSILVYVTNMLHYAYRFLSKSPSHKNLESKNVKRYVHIVYCVNVESIGLLPFITGGGYHKPNQGLRMTALRFSRLLLFAWILSMIFTVMSNVRVNAKEPEQLAFTIYTNLKCGYNINKPKVSLSQD